MGISIWQLLIILLIVVLLFGSKKLRSLGGDLGSAFRGFKKEMGDSDEKKSSTHVEHKDQQEDADFSSSVKRDHDEQKKD